VFVEKRKSFLVFVSVFYLFSQCYWANPVSPCTIFTTLLFLPNISYVYIGDVKCNVVRNVTPNLLTLANTISVAMPKVAKASTIVAVAFRCRQHYRLKYNANVNYPLRNGQIS
jgi:hypothetical protein